LQGLHVDPWARHSSSSMSIVVSPNTRSNVIPSPTSTTRAQGSATQSCLDGVETGGDRRDGFGGHSAGVNIVPVPASVILPCRCSITFGRAGRRFRDGESLLESSYVQSLGVQISSGSTSAFAPRFRENGPVRVLTRKLRSWSSWISSAACCFVVTPSTSTRLN